MILSWYDKKVVFEFYDIKNNKKEKFKDKDTSDIETLKKNDIDFKSNKIENKGNFYFTHNMTKDKSKQPEKFGYDINTTNVDCYVKGNALICDEQKIDFSQAVEEQGLSVNLNKNYIEISGSDLSYVDPVITYSFNITYRNVVMFGASDICTNAMCNGITINPLYTFTSSDYNSVSTSDNSRYNTGSSTSGMSAIKMYANLSSFKLSDITLVNWTFEGYGESAGTNIYLWNFTANNWTYFNNLTQSELTRNMIFYEDDYFINITSNLTYLFVRRLSSNSNLYCDFASLSITYDDLIINSPTSNQEILNTLSTTLNTSQAGYNQTIWYTWNSGIKNYTLCTNSNECQATITFPRQGYYNLSVYANKSDGTITSKNVNNLFVGNYSYQENADWNVSGGTWNAPSYLFFNSVDGDWNTYAYTSNSYLSTGYGFLNYSFNNRGIFVNSSWQVKDNVGIINLTLNNQCFDTSKNISLKFTSFEGSDSSSSYSEWLCFNYSNGNYISLRKNTGSHYTADRIYEEAVNWFYYSSNSPIIVTNTLSNNSNFSISNVNFTFNITDDNDYLTNISLILDGNINSTIYSPTINVSANNSFSFNITGITDGVHTWNIRAFDSDRVQTNSSTFTFTVDTTPPSVNIVIPEQGQTFTTTTIPLNFSISDATIGVSSCWYKNDTDANNITITNCQNITFTQSAGSHVLYFWANDTLNNVINITRNYAITLDAPSVNLDYPEDNQWFSYNSPIFFNFTADDPNNNGFENCTLWGNWTGTWHLNETNFSALSDNVMYTFNKSISDGFYKWNVNCWEATKTYNSWSLINKTFGIDTIFPSLKLFYPQNTTYNLNQLSLNFTAEDINRNTCWYNINSTNNITLTNCQNITFTANEGSSILNLFVNDSANNKNSSSITFFVDSIIPSISLNTSFLNNSYLNYNSSIKINVTATDTNLQSCWYNDNNGANTTFICGANLSLALSEALHTITVFANDTLNNQNNKMISFTPDVTYPIINITSISTTTGSQTVRFNSTAIDTNLYSCKYAIFNSSNGYDVANTTFTCNSNNTQFVVSAYATYNLTIYGLDLAGNENSTTKSFVVSPSSGIIGGGVSIPTNIILLSTVISENYSFIGANMLDFVLAKGSVKPREKIFYLNNKNVQEIPITLYCDTNVLENETSKSEQKINICDYVSFENRNLILSANELENTLGKISIKTPENASFSDVYSFNILAIYNASGTEMQFAKLSVVSRVPIWGLIFKYSSIPFSKVHFYPVTPVALFISFILFGLSLFLFRKLPLTSFLVGTLIFLTSFICLLIFL
jgi:hypothetical protein